MCKLFVLKSTILIPFSSMIEASLTFHSGGTFQSKIFFLDFIFFILRFGNFFLIRIKLFFIPSPVILLQIGKSFFFT